MISHPYKIKQQGVALILCLILSAVFAAISIYTSQKQNQQLKVLMGLQEKVELQNTANNLIQRLHFSILTNSEFEWQGQTVPLNGYNQPIDLANPQFADGKISLRIQDSSGLMTITDLDPQLYQKLIRNLSNSEELAERTIDEFLDWQDRDNLRRSNGKERDENSQPPYLPRNRRVQILSELQLLDSMELDLYNNLTLYTQYTTRTPFNERRASDKLRELLELAPLDESNRRNALYSQQNGLLVEEKQSFKISLEIQGQYSRFHRRYVITYRPEEIRLVSISEFGD